MCQIGEAKLAIIEEAADDVAATGMDKIKVVLKEPTGHAGPSAAGKRTSEDNQYS